MSAVQRARCGLRPRRAGERAERDGDEWVVNGQKVWSSGAHFSQRAILLARTDPSAPKHKGLTFFALDMETPGVTVRPLRQINGEVHFNEVFLDDVRIPDSDRIDEPGNGWQVALTTIMHERMTLAGAINLFRTEDLFTLAREGGHVDANDRDRLARAYTYQRCLEFLNARIMSKLAAGEIPTAEGAIAKLAMTRMLSAATDAAFGVLGPRAVTEQGLWQHIFLLNPGIRVGGGTDEVQRNMIAERVLGLPGSWTRPARCRSTASPAGSAGSWQRLRAANPGGYPCEWRAAHRHHEEIMMELSEETTAALIKRLRRIEGQVRGLQAMLAENRDCADIVTQVSAASRALDQVGFKLVASGLTYCMEHPQEAAEERLRRGARREDVHEDQLSPRPLASTARLPTRRAVDTWQRSRCSGTTVAPGAGVRP
ncbi:MAG: metal-sensing transcriptional repressor [Microthrixaceae bacterium]|nr:metal-sensing transcriptional repressor [Microthrixaceae bacterium]